MKPRADGAVLLKMLSLICLILLSPVMVLILRVGDGISASGFDFNDVSNGVTPLLTNFTIVKGAGAQPSSSAMHFSNDAKTVNVLNTIIAS